MQEITYPLNVTLLQFAKNILNLTTRTMHGIQLKSTLVFMDLNIILKLGVYENEQKSTVIC